MVPVLNGTDPKECLSHFRSSGSLQSGDTKNFTLTHFKADIFEKIIPAIFDLQDDFAKILLAPRGGK